MIEPGPRAPTAELSCKLSGRAIRCQKQRQVGRRGEPRARRVVPGNGPFPRY